MEKDSSIGSSSLLNILLVFTVMSMFFIIYLLPGRHFLYSYIPAIIFSYTSISFSIYRGKIALNWPLLLLIVFSLLCLASIIWSIDPDRTTRVSIEVAANTFTVLGMWFYFSSPSRIKFFLKTYLIVSGSAVFLGFLFDWSATDRMFLGLSSSGAAYLYGSSVVIAFLSWLLYDKAKYLYLIPLYLLPLFAVGSVRSIVMLVIIIIIYLLFRLSRATKTLSFSNIFKVVIASIVLVFVLYWAYHYGPEQYAIRLDRNIEYITSVLIYDADAVEIGGPAIRIGLLVTGVRYISNNPSFFGEGLHSTYMIYNQLIGRTTYSHNTLIDLLIGVGFVGAVLFYLIFLMVYYQVITNNCINVRLKDGFISILLSLIILSFAGRHYTQLEVFMLIVVICAILWQCKKLVLKVDEPIKAEC